MKKCHVCHLERCVKFAFHRNVLFTFDIYGLHAQNTHNACHLWSADCSCANAVAIFRYYRVVDAIFVFMETYIVLWSWQNAAKSTFGVFFPSDMSVCIVMYVCVCTTDAARMHSWLHVKVSFQALWTLVALVHAHRQYTKDTHVCARVYVYTMCIYIYTHTHIISELQFFFFVIIFSRFSFDRNIKCVIYENVRN